MTATSLATILLWAIAALIILGAMACVVVRRTAARVLVGALAVMLALIAFAAHLQVNTLAAGHLPELCRGAVQWFGIALTSSAEHCADYL